MTLRTMPLLVAALAATASLAAPQPGSPDLNGAERPRYAQVLSSRPVYHPARVPVPERECWEEGPLGLAAGSISLTSGPTANERGRYRCRTVTRFRDEHRLEAYEVTYRFDGRIYTTRMPYDPGTRVPVRIKPRAGRQ